MTHVMPYVIFKPTTVSRKGNGNVVLAREASRSAP